MADATIDLDTRQFGETIRGIKSAWQNRDIEQVSRQCAELLEHEPENLYGLIYLVKAAVLTDDADVLIRMGQKLSSRSPRDAFIAARKLTSLGRARDAALIFCDLQIKPDWFDLKIADLGQRQGAILLKAGEAAYRNGDEETARILWFGGSRIAPQNRALRNYIEELAQNKKEYARTKNLDESPAEYIEAWLELLKYDPASVATLTKLARAYERVSMPDAVTTWAKILTLEPTNVKAAERLNKLVDKHDLEESVIRVFVESGRTADIDLLLARVIEAHDLKTKTKFDKALKQAKKDAALRARLALRTKDPRKHLEAWKEVLVLDPTNIGAARKIISVARELQDYAELVNAIIAHLEILPGDSGMAIRLASAALQAGQEERALDYLAQHQLIDPSSNKIIDLQKRVLRACKSAMRSGEFDYALKCFAALSSASEEHPNVVAIRPILSDRAGSAARAAEKQGDLTIAVPLAEKVLAIMPTQADALTVVARDLWRHKRYDELEALCRAKVGPGREYGSVQKILDKLDAQRTEMVASAA